MDANRRWACARACPAALLALTLGLAAAPRASAADHALGPVGLRALHYFERAEDPTWIDSLRRIRPLSASPEAKARSLTLVRRQDLVTPSAARQAKLAALQPVLDSLERGGIEVKVLRAGLAWAGFLEGAAVLVTDEAVDIFSPEELQAVVAHELGHEYFAEEYLAARRRDDYDTVKEIELRCDAVSIIALRSLDRDPGALLSAVAKLTRFNQLRGVPNSRDLTPAWEERQRFNRAMIALVDGRGAGPVRAGN